MTYIRAREVFKDELSRQKESAVQVRLYRGTYVRRNVTAKYKIAIAIDRDR